MICPVGRLLDEQHPTCRSCRSQGVICSTKPKKAKPAEGVRTWYVGRVLVTTAYLDSMNAWHGRPRYVYTRIRRKWEQILFGTIHLWGWRDDRRVLNVRRYVQSSSQLIKDRDNLVGAVKPVKDTLVRIGILTDDTDADVEFDIQQFVERDNPRTEIEVV